MPKLDIPPTKSSLLRVQRDLEVALEGYDLLEQKRQILVIELMNQVARAKTIQEEVETALVTAFEAVREAALTVGSEAMRRESTAVRGEHRVRVTSRPVMGIALPTVVLEMAPLLPAFAPGEGSARADRVLLAFRKVLALIGQLAEVETAVFRVARELRKTQRRVNALDKIFIPTYRQTVTFITAALEERDREGFITMKMLKARAERRQEERR
jgi:V/A-type H+-transporting ATPase subunit D